MPSLVATATTQLTLISQVRRLEKICINISANPPVETKINGTIALRDRSNYTLILKSGNEVRIPPQSPNLNNRVFQPHVSPNGKYIMYQQYGGISFRKADGSGLKDFFADTNSIWLFYYEWISNELVRIPTILDNNTEKLLALDFVTGKYQELRTDFPGLADGSLINWGIDNGAIHSLITKGVNVVYDPSLARAVYPKDNQFVVLYDVENNKELASTQLKDWGNSPQWSPDGKNLSIKASVDSASGQPGDDFFLLSRDGSKFTRLTSLANLYPGASLGAYSWSPDSQRIAFWLKTSETTSANAVNPYSLILLDVKTGKVTSTCILGIGLPMSITISPSPNFRANIVDFAKPVWSPDKTQMLITQLTADKRNYDVILVDLAKQTAYKIAENIDPIGWMTKEP